MVEMIGATALNAVYALIKADTALVGTVWMNSAPDAASGLVREIGEADDMPDLTMGTLIAVERSTIEIGVRGEPRDYETPRNEAARLRYWLLSQKEFTAAGVTVMAILPRGSIQPVGRDATQREMFVIRFEVMAVPSYEE